MTICKGLTRIQAKKIYYEVLSDKDIEAQRRLCREDLFFLLVVALQRKDVDRNWLYDRCREVELDSDGYLDLWAREHYKSTIISYGKTMQDILSSHGKNPLPKWKGRELTAAFFSCKRALAKDLLYQIKIDFEEKRYLKNLFPDILYEKPSSEAPLWSLNEGIIVKRKSNPREATVEAWGLVDGMPTGKHFYLRVYDDVITDKFVTSPEMIKKVTQAWELSDNLKAEGGIERYIGTRYHFNDTYRTIMERKAVIPRIYPATDNGKDDGNPVFISKEALVKKRRNQGLYTFGCQMLQNPVADKAMGFKGEWLRYYDVNRVDKEWNFYLICDPASEKKKENDFTVMDVIALAPDKNYYWVDGVRDKLNLTERTKKLIVLHKKWKPIETGYEKYGMQSDIEHIEDYMDRINYRFDITELGGNTPKNDRIRKLVPIFEYHRFYIPYHLYFIDNEGKERDLVKEFREEEYEVFPVGTHDDMLDCKARILDEKFGADFPIEVIVNPGNINRARREYRPV